MAPPLLPGTAKNLLLLFASTLFSLLLAVSFLFFFYMHANPSVYRLDEHCLYRLIPGAIKEYRHLRLNGGGLVTVRINREGYRGDELADRALVHRVVVYGDSFIEAEATPLEQTFCRRLEVLLDARLPATRLEVVNAGVMGYGPDQVSLRLPDELGSLSPDLVIVALYAGNDFGDLLRNKLYRLGPDGSLQEQHPVLGANLRAHLARSSEAERVDGGALRRLFNAVYWTLNPKDLAHEVGLPQQGRDEGYVAWSLRAAQAEYTGYVEGGDPEVVNLFGDHYDADVALRPGSEVARYKIALMERVLGRIVSTLAAHGTPLLLLIVPCAIDVCPDRHARGIEAELRGEVRSTLTDLLEGIARRLDVPALNLFAPFRAESDRAHLYFREPETHWNAAGQELAARSTVDLILSRGLLGRR
jgi:hypothetical protein